MTYATGSRRATCLLFFEHLAQTELPQRLQITSLFPRPMKLTTLNSAWQSEHSSFALLFWVSALKTGGRPNKSCASLLSAISSSSSSCCRLSWKVLAGPLRALAVRRCRASSESALSYTETNPLCRGIVSRIWSARSKTSSFSSSYCCSCCLSNSSGSCTGPLAGLPIFFAEGRLDTIRNCLFILFELFN